MTVPQGLLALLREARHVAMLTGAGISAESGIPTFREAQTGLWSQYDAEELATRAAFRRNPGLIWRWYEWRRQLVAEAQPNPGHLALVSLAARMPRLTLITQNIDGLHQRAGSDGVIELHGNITRSKCFDNDHPAESWPVAAEEPPPCPVCGSPLRPDVVWFGESLPYRALGAALEASRECDLFFSVGTSALVQPAASLPLEALRRRIPVVEVNPDETPLTPYASSVLTGPAGEILPRLVREAWPDAD